MSVCLLIVWWSAGCQRVIDPPADYRQEALDVKTAVQDADMIVLARPTSQRDIGSELHVRLAGRTEPLRLQETETALAPLQIFKGAVPPNEIRFRHYKTGSGYIQQGPPQGPSGGIGAPGIFFLKSRPGGVFRSFVDLYRPDIPTPWITGSWDALQCNDASDCILQTVFRFRSGDSGRSFSNALLVNTGLAHHFAGHIKTLQLLSDLVAESNPEGVKRTACVELSKWYVLEFPGKCKSFIAGTPTENEYLQRLALNRAKLKEGGLRWLRERYQLQDSEMARELELLRASDDTEVRSHAEALLRDFRKQQ